MKMNQKSKSWNERYNPSPFFFRQRYSEGFRLVAWTPKLAQLKKLVYCVLEIFPEDIDILLKIRNIVCNQFQRYYGRTELKKLIQILKANEIFVFSDGGHQLCVKRPDTDEHIALDDHDVLFIYSDSKALVDICCENGFERKRRKLIYSARHWHIYPKDSEVLTRKFIKGLKLKAVKTT